MSTNRMQQLYPTQLLKSTQTTQRTRNTCSGIKDTDLGIIYTGSSRSTQTCPWLMTCFREAALIVAALDIDREVAVPYDGRPSVEIILP